MSFWALLNQLTECNDDNVKIDGDEVAASEAIIDVAATEAGGESPRKAGLPEVGAATMPTVLQVQKTLPVPEIKKRLAAAKDILKKKEKEENKEYHKLEEAVATLLKKAAKRREKALKRPQQEVKLYEDAMNTEGKKKKKAGDEEDESKEGKNDSKAKKMKVDSTDA